MAENVSSADENWMRRCLAEARKGMGFTSPNPLVGAIVVKNGSLLAAGYHHRDGAAHAEVDALSQLAPGAASGATVYVNLEPCCHFGRTPPCSNALISAGVSRVVVANLDPDERVSGQGVAQLRDAGVRVDVGLLAAEAERLNSIYMHFRRTRRPYVVLKAALTLDGKIATNSGHSKWISNDKSREVAHALRRRLRAVAVGRGTVEADSPKLNCRLPGWEEKPVDKLIFSQTKTETELEPLLTGMRSTSGRVFVLGASDVVSRQSFFDFCAGNGIDSVLVEGGGRLHAWFLKNQLVDRAILFYKPAFMGGNGVPVFAGESPLRASELEEFTIHSVTVLDNNLMVDLCKGEPLCLLD